MRIVIDLQGAQTGSRHRGIGRYSLSLVKEIVRNRDEHDIILALSGTFPDTIEFIRDEFNELLPQENIRLWYGPSPVNERQQSNVWRREAAELIREKFLQDLEPDLILITSLFEGYWDDAVVSVGKLDKSPPVFTVLYDLIPLMNSGNYLSDKAEAVWYKNKITSCSKSDFLLSISESSRQEAIKYLDVKPEFVANISSGVDSIFKPNKASRIDEMELRSKFGLQKDYLAYSGATDVRKNHLRLIDAYSKLPLEIRNNHQLAIIGGMPEEHKTKFIEHAVNCGLKKNEMIITGRVSDDEMVALINLCKVFVFPSWHEGFGLPALEAMKCGKAVIASNTSSLPEVVGEPKALFDPHNTESISNKIKDVLINDDFRTELERYNLERAVEFSWEKTALLALSAMESNVEQISLMKDASKTPRIESVTSEEVLIEYISKLTSPYTENDLLIVAECISKNQISLGKKQLLVDISELVQHDAKSGIQRVVRSILKELLAYSSEDLQVRPVYASVEHGYLYADDFISKFIGSEIESAGDFPIEYNAGDVFLGLDFQPQVVKAQKKFYREMREHGVTVSFVVYDLLCIQLPHFFIDGAMEAYSEWLDVVTDNDRVFCISKSVAKELESWAIKNKKKRVRPLKIDWFHLGADINSSSPSKGLQDNSLHVLQQLSEQPSFLMVGTIEPRKGYAQTLAAFEALWSQNNQLNLVIVGKEGWLVDDLVQKIRQHPELNKRLFWLEGISDEYLEKIYATSTCLIAASEGEGFGLPLIEAAQYGLPILARDIPVFKEVAGEHAYYFTGNTSDSLFNALKSWLNLFSDGKSPHSKNMPWLTWEESTAALLAVIKNEQK